MKKKLIVFLILATLMLSPTVLAKPKKAIKCTHEILFNGVIWYGTVTFPNEAEYYLVWTIDPDPDFVGHKKSPVFPLGKVEKFYEWWALYLDEGDYDPLNPEDGVLASGWDKGVFDADSWKYVMNGQVDYVDPIGELAYLEGARVHASGVATPLTDGPPFFEGEGIFTFSGYAGQD